MCPSRFPDNISQKIQFIIQEIDDFIYCFKINPRLRDKIFHRLFFEKQKAIQNP